MNSIDLQRERDIRELSDPAFASHQIQERMRSGVFRSWRCQRPGIWTYGFDITTTPGYLFLTGDIGGLIVSREFDMLPWCRTACNDARYFASKVEGGVEGQQEFAREMVDLWISERLKDDSLAEFQVDAIEDVLIEGTENNGPDYFYRVFNDVDLFGGDPPSWRAFKHQFFWKRDAIRWFVNNHSEPEVSAPK